MLDPTKQKILCAIPCLVAGGAERVMVTLVNHWVNNGRDIVLVTFDPETSEPYYPVDKDVVLERLDLEAPGKSFIQQILVTLRRIRAMRNVIRTEQPDVIISFLTKTNIIALLAARGLGTPVIVSERNNPKVQMFNRFWKVARSLTYPFAYSFVTMTNGAAEYYPKWQRPRTRIIPNPISLPIQWSNRRNGDTITAVGRLSHQKRFDILLEAFANIADQFPDWRLVIWGEGEERETLENLRRQLGLEDRVSLPGVTDFPATWIETTDILASTSDYEGWGNVLSEAMAAKIPIVATNCEFGIPSMIEDRITGVLATPGDAASVAAGLALLIEDKALRDYVSENAAKKVRAYSMESIAAQWDEIISLAHSKH